MKKLTVFICFALVTAFAQAQWMGQDSQTGACLTSVFFPNDNIGYAVGGGISESYPYDYSNGIVIKTLNGGATWDTVWCLETLIPPRLNSVYFLDANIGFVAGYSSDSTKGIILKTMDGGATWTESYNDSGYLLELKSVYFTDANTGYIVGGRGIHYQKNGYSPALI